MWPYPWTHVGTPSHLGHMDRVAATMPSQAHAGAAQEAPDIGQWEGQDVPLVRPSSCNVKGGIPSSRRYLPTYLPHRCSRVPCVCPALVSALPLPRRPIPSPLVSPVLPSSPPIRCHSEGPVCTFPSALTAFAVHSLVCATRVFYPRPSLLSLPFSLVSCRTLTPPSLLGCCPLSLWFAFVPCLSPLPGRHGFMLRGGGLLADWIVVLLVDGLDAGLLGSDHCGVPHAACRSEPPMGSTVANAVLVGPAPRAGNHGAPCHLWPFATVTTPR